MLPARSECRYRGRIDVVVSVALPISVRVEECEDVDRTLALIGSDR